MNLISIVLCVLKNSALVFHIVISAKKISEFVNEGFDVEKPGTTEE